MIPIALTLEGFYSYQHRQTLDFSNLTNAGLFGIFGEVGSGKSSILEAITFALYGNSDRLGATNFAYNMMNLKSNRLFVEFSFSNHAGHTYKITREYKRNSRQFEKITNAGVVLYELLDNQWIPLPSSNVESIIGLSSENFRRTIIIPQGQFKEFIELKPAARTQMMKEIFNLHRFDLQDKVSALNNKNSELLQHLNGKLSGFDEVSEEKTEELTRLLQQQSEFQSAIAKTYNELSAHLQHLEVLKGSFEELKVKETKLESLSLQQKETNKRKRQLEDYERTYDLFYSLLEEQNRLESELYQKTKQLQDDERDLHLTDVQMAGLATALETLKPLYESLDSRKMEENDLELIGEILEFSIHIAELRERSSKGIQKVEEVRARQKSARDRIAGLEIEIHALSEQRIDAQILMNAGQWFTKQYYLTDSLNTRETESERLKQQLSDIGKRLPRPDFNEHTLNEQFNAERLHLEEQKKRLEVVKSQFNVQQELAQYTHRMQDGVPCPLCGALEHPAIIEINDVTAQLQVVHQEITALDAALNTLQNSYNENKTLLSQLEFIRKQLMENQMVLQQLQTEISDHTDLFIWKSFSISDSESFELKKEETALLEKQISLKTKELEMVRKDVETESELLEKYTKALEHFKLEEARKEIQLQQNKSRLKRYRFEDFSHETTRSIQNQLNKLKDNNEKTEREYTVLTKQYHDLLPKQVSQKTAIAIAEKQITELKHRISSLRDQVRISLEAQKIQTIEEVHAILNLQFDTPTVRKEIERFTIEYETLKNSVNELHVKLKDVVFDESIYIHAQEKLERTENALKAATEEQTKTKTELNRLFRAFDEKRELLIQREELQKRAANLSTLRGLFTAAGFVQYVSSIYLRQLCENANVRFHRMTRNQLSLQINENNDFEIIDYLNEGKSRSVKTLSGGQLFQVSLSLALALAESVQFNAKSDKNFFFIDEGFGTQDTDSVNIVFETLVNLQKENRIVGIISHVEELKDRIPVSLTVVKDKEKGSSFIQND